MADLVKIYENGLPRNRVYLVAGSLGVVAGCRNSYLDLYFSLRPGLFLRLLAALIVTIALHEGVHGVVQAPARFGLKWRHAPDASAPDAP